MCTDKNIEKNNYPHPPPTFHYSFLNPNKAGIFKASFFFGRDST